MQLVESISKRVRNQSKEIANVETLHNFNNTFSYLFLQVLLIYRHPFRSEQRLRLFASSLPCRKSAFRTRILTLRLMKNDFHRLEWPFCRLKRFTTITTTTKMASCACLNPSTIMCTTRTDIRIIGMNLLCPILRPEATRALM